MKYDYELQCYIGTDGRVQLCGHPQRMIPDCCNGGKYAGMMQIDARAAAGIDAITAGDIATQTAKPAAAAAFDAAVNCGRLSADHTADNYAGHYMYMGETDHGPAFKHSLTREYLTYEI